MATHPHILLGSDLTPTRKLFHHDPYKRNCQAQVLVVRGNHVVTNQTVLYAESGGQDSDTGWIEGIPVVDVHKQYGRPITVRREGVDVPSVVVDTVIVHTLAEPPPFAAGDTVNIQVDWGRRYQLMRHHSASHFLFHACHQICSNDQDTLYTKGCSITADSARFDFSGNIPGDRVQAIEDLANQLIARNEDITMESESLTDEIWYWRYAGILIPCGGTHVANARELGEITVRRSKKGQTTTRVSLDFSSNT